MSDYNALPNRILNYFNITHPKAHNIALIWYCPLHSPYLVLSSTLPLFGTVLYIALIWYCLDLRGAIYKCMKLLKKKGRGHWERKGRVQKRNGWYKDSPVEHTAQTDVLRSYSTDRRHLVSIMNCKYIQFSFFFLGGGGGGGGKCKLQYRNITLKPLRVIK